jgi:hypothetical protein
MYNGIHYSYTEDSQAGYLRLTIYDDFPSGILAISGKQEGIYDFINLVTINYTIMSSGEFKISNALPYPSPYNPDNGDLRIGFDCTRAGVEYSVHIYDVSGREVFQETGLTTAQGYNRYNWDGKFSGGGTVGRGVYVTRLHFEGYAKQDVVTKFGVR